MASVSRRHFLGASLVGGVAAGAAAGGLGVAGLGGGTALAATTGAAGVTIPGEVTVTSADQRYSYLSTRGMNKLYTNTPKSIYQVFSSDQVRDAVQTAVGSGQQIAVRSGGHCLGDLVDNPSVSALIDVSQLNAVSYDPVCNAFSVGSGTQLGDLYKQLYLGYGVVAPGGSCPTVGVGGFVQGGGFGSLCRLHGLIVDHLSGIEVVTVSASGKAEIIVATNDPADPHQSLWWAHTGSGGGNYGVVTRYLFRSPDATGTDPTKLLPPPPRASLVTIVEWPWSSMTEPAFTRLVNNHGSWHAANSAPGTPYASLFSGLVLDSYSQGSLTLIALMDATVPNATEMMNEYVAALNAGVSAPSTVTEQATMPWLDAIYSYLFGGLPTPYDRERGKGAYLREPFSAGQVSTLYKYLSDPSYADHGLVLLYSYGGQVNAVSPTATVAAQRDSILKAYFATSWEDAAHDDANIAWLRAFYQEVYAETGGVPVVGGVTDGSYINFPDPDLADPTWNTSADPWYTLYFKDNYPRLQQVKAAYDPGNVFRHPLSVQLPTGK
jgi:FAD binding domain/Berberine and berberine like